MALQEHMQYLMVRGTQQGYFMELTKSILFVSLRNLLREDEYFRGMGVRVVTGRCYLGGFIGDPVKEKVGID